MLEKTPVLSRGCRLQDSTLLIPEGLVKLSAGGERVIRLCDGTRTVKNVISELQLQHSKDISEKIEKETLHFVESLIAKRWLSFV